MMSTSLSIAIGGWFLCLALAIVLELLVAKLVRAVQLSASPLSGENTDSFVYHRSIFTPGEASLAPVWAGLVVAGGSLWASWGFGVGWLLGLPPSGRACS